MSPMSELPLTFDSCPLENSPENGNLLSLHRNTKTMNRSRQFLDRWTSGLLSFPDMLTFSGR